VRRVIASVVDILPLDTRGRRAVDETLADWKHEAGEARTIAGRLVAGVRGAAAVAVAVTSVAVRDVTSAETFGIVGLVAGSALLMGIGLTYRSFEDHAGYLAARGLTDAPLLGMWSAMLPQTVSLCIPLTLLAPPVRRAATRSLIGPCVILMALSAANLGWIGPQAHQWLRQTTFDLLQRHDGAANFGTPRLPRGSAEYTAVDLVRHHHAGGARAQRAATDLNRRGAMLVMVPVCLVLGVQARRLGTARRWRAGAGLLAWSAFAIGYIVATLIAILTADSLRLFSLWLAPLVCAAIAFGLARLVSAARFHRGRALTPTV
jgi:hypothetical protein